MNTFKLFRPPHFDRGLKANNGNGQLGDGTCTNRLTPVRFVPAVESPFITGIQLAGTNLVLTATNGESGATYVAFTSTSLVVPFNRCVATNVPIAGGGFIITATNAVDQKAAQRFFIRQFQN